MPELPAMPSVEPVTVPDGPRGSRQRKSLVIGVDGTLLQRMREADAPNLQRLMAEGTTSETQLPYGEPPAAESVSGTGWSTIACGVWPEKHGVRDNTFRGKAYEKYPDFLTRLKRCDSAVSTFVIANWAPVAATRAGGPIFSEAVDVRIGLDGGVDGFRLSDARSAEAAARYLREQDPDVAFVYFGQVDKAGHSTGPGSPEYLEALARVDVHVGTLLDALQARPGRAQEDWLLLVTTDHGHRPEGGHGGGTVDERSTFVIAHAAGIAAGRATVDTRAVDVAPTVFAHAGVEPDAIWGLDGRAMPGLLARAVS